MTKKIAGIIIVVALLAVGAAWYYTPFLVANHAGAWVTDKQGQFGDIYGSVNALFSGIGVVGLTLTLLLQWNELRNTDRAVKDSNNLTRASGLLATLPQTIRKEFTLLQQLDQVDYQSPDLWHLSRVTGKIKDLEEKLEGHRRGLATRREELKSLVNGGDSQMAEEEKKQVAWLEKCIERYELQIATLKKIEAYEKQIEAAQRIMMLAP